MLPTMSNDRLDLLRLLPTQDPRRQLHIDSIAYLQRLPASDVHRPTARAKSSTLSKHRLEHISDTDRNRLHHSTWDEAGLLL